VSTTASRLPSARLPSWVTGLRRAWTNAGSERTTTYLLLLMVVVLIPFSTVLLAHHFRDGANAHAAAVFYGLVAMVMGAAFTAMWVYLGRHPELLADGHDAAYARGRSVRTAVAGPSVYLVATVVGLVNAAASLILYAAVPVYFAFSRSADAGPTSR